MKFRSEKYILVLPFHHSLQFHPKQHVILHIKKDIKIQLQELQKFNNESFKGKFHSRKKIF